MKNFKTLVLLCTLALFSTQTSIAQKFSGLDKIPMDAASYPTSYKVSDKDVKVTYSRPQLKGRPLSKLAPNGEVWRTGANEAAEITFYTPMSVGKSVIKPGTYSLFTIPGEKEWTIIINKDINVWGAYTYNEKNDVARFKAPVTMNKETIEAFSIAFDEGKSGINMYLGWGNIVAKAVLTSKPKKRGPSLMKQ